MANAEVAASELATLIQAAHIKANPDPKHDSNPSTTAEPRNPVHIRPHTADPDLQDPDSEEIPLSLLEPARRKQNLPPLPDLRFEQSYLASIKDCKNWQAVTWTTFLNHVVLPLTQGLMYSLAVFGWRAWNRASKFHGQGVGARIRKWWWGVNNWPIPEQKGKKL